MNRRFGLWLAVGIGIGAAIGVALDNIPTGFGFGAAAGVLAALMQKVFSKK